MLDVGCMGVHYPLEKVDDLGTGIHVVSEGDSVPLQTLLSIANWIVKLL